MTCLFPHPKTRVHTSKWGVWSLACNFAGSSLPMLDMEVFNDMPLPAPKKKGSYI